LKAAPEATLRSSSSNSIPPKVGTTGTSSHIGPHADRSLAAPYAAQEEQGDDAAMVLVHQSLEQHPRRYVGGRS
jgi:hypothetical protein